MNDVVSKLRSPRFAALGLPALAITGAMLSLHADPQAQTPPGAVANDVTFTRDVAPIMQGLSGLPSPRLDRADVAVDLRGCPAVGALNQAKVSTREMPPWYIDRTVGMKKFKDDPSLSDEEIATIVKWADAGAPRGNQADMPPPRQFADTDKWPIGKPDYVSRDSRGIVVKANGADEWPRSRSTPS